MERIKNSSRWLFVITALLLNVCNLSQAQNMDHKTDQSHMLDKYTEFTLVTDLAELDDNQKKIITLLIEAGKEMDKVFWKEAYGNKEELMEMIDDPLIEKFAQINYGPWDRLNEDSAFVEGAGPKPAGANFYPADMNKEEFKQWDSEDKDDLYTLVRRGENGELKTVPYHQAFAREHEAAAEKLKKAAELAENEGLKNYLNLRAEALLTDEYRASDMAWLEMKDNLIDVVIGPIETYEDQLFGYKAAHETFVLIKDKEWSRRLEKYAEVLPELQQGLPVDDKYKQETPGRDSDLNAYDAVYYAGSANAGSKTIAINLPNDEKVQLEKGTRRLQLKNAMRAKYNKILVPIAEVLINEDQRKYITFDAFFSNTMFHEVAHGLGIKNTVNGRGTVREALKEYASALEEGKADVLGLYMVSELRNDGIVREGSMKNNYVTFMASIFRSVRFGTSSAHGQANLIRFNYFKEKEAFTYDPESNSYSVNFDKMAEASDSLSNKILTLQGNGDYKGVANFVKKYGRVDTQLEQSLNRLARQSIPVDIVFRQGVDVLGLKQY